MIRSATTFGTAAQSHIIDFPTAFSRAARIYSHPAMATGKDFEPCLKDSPTGPEPCLVPIPKPTFVTRARRDPTARTEMANEDGTWRTVPRLSLWRQRTRLPVNHKIISVYNKKNASRENIMDRWW